MKIGDTKYSDAGDAYTITAIGNSKILLSGPADEQMFSKKYWENLHYLKPLPEKTATVRLVQENGKYWYEENLGGVWVVMEGTEMSCRGNADYELEKIINARREELANARMVGVEREIKL